MNGYRSIKNIATWVLEIISTLIASAIEPLFELKKLWQIWSGVISVTVCLVVIKGEMYVGRSYLVWLSLFVYGYLVLEQIYDNFKNRKAIASLSSEKKRKDS
jgi:hypothetical protein